MVENEKYLIVSPHSDDALLCAAHVILGDGFEVEIVTVENDPIRIEEDKKLYGFLNIPFHHLDVEFKDESYYGHKKEYPQGVTVENSFAYLRSYLGSDTLNEIEEALHSFIRKFFKDKKHRGFKILAPWGIGHPFHLFVRYCVQLEVSNAEYYREFPHSYKKRAQAQVELQSREYELVRSVPVEGFADIKWKLARKFYRSQSGLLFYEQGYIKKNLPEEIWARDVLPF
jgi:hypothetical protein